MRLFFRPKFERYTEPARRVILFSLREAQRAGSAGIAPEHIAAALFDKNQPMFEALILADQVQALRERLGCGVAGELPSPGPDRPLSREVRDALAAAEKLAGHGEVQPVHLLAGLASGRTALAQMLAEYGITPERITSIFP